MNKCSKLLSKNKIFYSSRKIRVEKVNMICIRISLIQSNNSRNRSLRSIKLKIMTILKLVTLKNKFWHKINILLIIKLMKI